jgi:hypothetical protein
MLSTLLNPLPYHILAYGTFLGSQLYQVSGALLNIMKINAYLLTERMSSPSSIQKSATAPFHPKTSIISTNACFRSTSAVSLAWQYSLLSRSLQKHGYSCRLWTMSGMCCWGWRRWWPGWIGMFMGRGRVRQWLKRRKWLKVCCCCHIDPGTWVLMDELDRGSG